MGADGPLGGDALDDIGPFVRDGAPVDRPEVPILPFADGSGVNGDAFEHLFPGDEIEDGEPAEGVARMPLDDRQLRAGGLVTDVVRQDLRPLGRNGRCRPHPDGGDRQDEDEG